MICWTYLSLYGVPCILQAGIVIRAVQNQPLFQVLSGIFTHLSKTEVNHGIWRTCRHNTRHSLLFMKADLHLVGVDEEEDEENELCQEDGQQNDEKLKKKHE